MMEHNQVQAPGRAQSGLSGIRVQLTVSGARAGAGVPQSSDDYERPRFPGPGFPSLSERPVPTYSSESSERFYDKHGVI